MKDVAIPFRAGFKAKIKKGEEKVIFSGDDFEVHMKIRKRGQAIVQSGLDIEYYVKEILGRLLFNKTNEKEFLTGLLLDNSACTFGVKRKLLQSSLKHFDLLTPKEINDLEGCLSKIMKYRNAFAHGNIPTTKPFSITYFEGTKQTKELTEEYWDTLVGHLDTAFESLGKLDKKILEKGM